MCFIADHDRPTLGCERKLEITERLVRRQHDLGRPDPVGLEELYQAVFRPKSFVNRCLRHPQCREGIAIHRENRQGARRKKLLRLLFPVLQKCHRGDDQHGIAMNVVLDQPRHECQQLQRLPQPHVVSEHSASNCVVVMSSEEVLHPSQSGQLVWHERTFRAERSRQLGFVGYGLKGLAAPLFVVHGLDVVAHDEGLLPTPMLRLRRPFLVGFEAAATNIVEAFRERPSNVLGLLEGHRLG